MIRAPPPRKLRNLFLKSVTLSRYTLAAEDINDAFGQRDRTLSGTYTLKAEIQEVTSEDIAFYIAGTVNLGDAWGFFQASYFDKGKQIVIAPLDEITWNGKTWMIDTIEDAFVGEQLWFKKAFLRRLI